MMHNDYQSSHLGITMIMESQNRKPGSGCSSSRRKPSDVRRRVHSPGRRRRLPVPGAWEAASTLRLASTEGTEYYLSATEKGGEPPGKWIGEGLAELGIHDGDKITAADRELFEKIYGDFQDVRDPSGEAHLGSAPRDVQQAQAIYQRKLDAEPEATAERRRKEMMTGPRPSARYDRPLLGDTTFSPDKTITLAHASALAAAKEAREAGDAEAADLWDSRAAGVWEEIEKAARLYIDHQQQESGYVRTGHHGARVGDAEAGRFERAADIPVAIFPQHTSRNGDPQLHVHILWLNRVQTESDGAWRAIDSRALTRNKQEGAVKAAFALESALSQRYGFSWAYREEGKGTHTTERGEGDRRVQFAPRADQRKDTRARAGV